MAENLKSNVLSPEAPAPSQASDFCYYMNYNFIIFIASEVGHEENKQWAYGTVCRHFNILARVS